jgi:hypothetical protein
MHSATADNWILLLNRIQTAGSYPYPSVLKMHLLLDAHRFYFLTLFVPRNWFQVSGFSAASGLKSGQFDRRRNFIGA